MSTSYYDSAEDIKISKSRAIQECAKHGVSAWDMVSDLGDHETYQAQAVLAFLGY
jgi:hypothetical protein